MLQQQSQEANGNNETLKQQQQMSTKFNTVSPEQIRKLYTVSEVSKKVLKPRSSEPNLEKFQNVWATVCQSVTVATSPQDDFRPFKNEPR